MVNSQHEELKEAVHVELLAEVRKNCNVVIRGAEDGPNEQDLLKMYKNFIQQLELMDGTASLGMRGRDLPPEQLSEQHNLQSGHSQTLSRLQKTPWKFLFKVTKRPRNVSEFLEFASPCS